MEYKEQIQRCDITCIDSKTCYMCPTDTGQFVKIPDKILTEQ